MRQAVILVGGRGTRLGALAHDTPKPLLPIAGDVRFLDYLLDNIARHGVSDIILIAGHLGEQIEQRYNGARFRGADVSVVREPAPAGTAGALRYVADRLDDVFLMSNGDSLFDINYLALTASFPPGDAARLALRRAPDAQRYGRVSLSGDRITGFHEKDPTWTGAALISGGVYVLRRRVLDLVDRVPLSIESDVFPELCARGVMSGQEFSGFFLDIGLPETLAEARVTLPAHMRRAAVFFDRDGTLTRDDGYTYRTEDLEFLPSAVAAIRACNDAGTLAIVVTNQSGVARGKYHISDVAAFHTHMQAQLRERGAHIDAFYACPFHADGIVPAYTRTNHPDRKPNPGLIRRALLEWPIDPARAVVIGDQPHDAAAGLAAGISAVEIKPGALLATIKQKLDLPMPATAPLPISALKDCAERARAWLFDHALPIWWERGFDRTSQCFHEALDHTGAPVDAPRRVRVQARQTYVYAAAGKLGWAGPWREAVEAGARVLANKAILADGGTAYLLDTDGAVLDARHDLYDTAFVVFALAHASSALNDPSLAAKAADLFAWAKANWSHPSGGFREGDLTPVPPRRQNPHMHLLEALLALHETTSDARFLDEANVIIRLFESRFVSAEWGALLEYFDDDWRPADGDEGRITEPGHQFEWAWLADRLHRQGGHDARMLARRIQVHGEVYGVDPETGVVVDEAWAEGGVKAATSRLWPYTERIKANVVHFERTGDPQSAANAVQAFDSLMSYCAVPIPGLWRDRRLASGAFADGPAPASSFYHVMVALTELIRVSEGR